MGIREDARSGAFIREGEKMLYCPRCGRRAAERHKFCTGCGLPLSAIFRILAAEGQINEGSSPQELARRLKDLRQGVQQMFSGLGLALFFFLFFESVKFAALGAIVFFIGLGRVVSAMLMASSPVRVTWSVPRGEIEPSGEEEKHEGEKPPARGSSFPSVAEPTTLPLDPPARGAIPQ